MKTSRLFVFLLIIVFSACASSKLKEKTDGNTVKTGEIKDMVLIYSGGSHRTITWDASHFEPYVYAEDKDGKYQWLFDGFLFLEIHDGKERGYASGYRKLSARKEDWIWLITQYLTDGNDIKALDDCIEKAKSKCGRVSKRKIVISLPEPIPNQKDWGELNGKSLDFSNDEDRIVACKWYIDYIIEKFKAAKMKNVELSGFYWLAEEATHTRTFVKQVADYIHAKKCNFYWIPYFKSDGYHEWRNLGFDQAFLQPNHFFNASIPDSRIDEACTLAKSLGMSMEMEFDERAVEGGGMADRLHAYIDGFERNHIFEKTDIAYYQGNDALYKLKNGTKADNALYHKLTYIIIDRQKDKSKK